MAIGYRGGGERHEQRRSQHPHSSESLVRGTRLRIDDHQGHRGRSRLLPPCPGHEDLRQQSSAVLGCDPVRTSDGRGSECDATGDIGCQLVEKLVARRESDETDPWAMLAVHVHEAPDPAAARAEIKQRYVHGIARRIGDTEPGLVRSQIVVSLLLGLATGMRTLELLGEDSLSSEDLIRRYGRLIQIAVDEIEPVSEHESFISDTVEE